MPAKSILLLLLIAGISLGLYVLYGSNIVAKLASAGNHEPNTELNAPEDALTKTGIVQDSRLTEISGIDASFGNPNAYWVHNDSGNPAEVFLIAETGETLMRVILEGAKNIDWEDISVFQISGKNYVCVADVGDNTGKRQSCNLYLFEEPKLPKDGSEKPHEVTIKDFKKLKFTYEDGPRNCEAIAFDHKGQSLFLFQKAIDKKEKEKSFGIYELKFNVNDLALQSNVAVRIAENTDRITTGAAISRDAKQLILCNYAVGAWATKPLVVKWSSSLNNSSFKPIPLPVQRQREAICFSADSKSAIVVSEFGKQPIWKINLNKVLNPKTQ